MRSALCFVVFESTSLLQTESFTKVFHLISLFAASKAERARQREEKKVPKEPKTRSDRQEMRA